MTTYQGYMVEADFDGSTLRMRGSNKAARVALAGEDHEHDVVLTREQVASADLKDAGMMTNGNLRIRSADGKTYQLHFRKKQADGMKALAAALGADVR